MAPLDKLKTRRTEAKDAESRRFPRIAIALTHTVVPVCALVAVTNMVIKMVLKMVLKMVIKMVFCFLFSSHPIYDFFALHFFAPSS